MSRYIDADLLKDKTTRVNNIWNVTTNAEGKGLDEIIDDIPPADVRENVRGDWVGGELGECPICGHKGCASDIWTGCNEKCYCPNCGAELVVE